MVLFATDSIVPLVVVIIVAIMLIITLREVMRTRPPTDSRVRENPTPPPYISSSSDPYGYRVRSSESLAPAPSTAEEMKGSGPVDMTLYDPDGYQEVPAHRLAIATYNFVGFDAKVGPPDWDSFYDEIMVEIYDEETSERWHTRYFVASPAGLARFMREERWNAMSGNNHIIVLRYDLQKIIEAVLLHMNKHGKRMRQVCQLTTCASSLLRPAEFSADSQD